jgi:hypothetical protein
MVAYGMVRIKEKFSNQEAQRVNIDVDGLAGEPVKAMRIFSLP